MTVMDITIHQAFLPPAADPGVTEDERRTITDPGGNVLGLLQDR